MASARSTRTAFVSALFALSNREVDAFGGEQAAGHELTRDEAVALGHLEAEGEWGLDHLHAVDGGQATRTFWWA
jgi:hypothetical protein